MTDPIAPNNNTTFMQCYINTGKDNKHLSIKDFQNAIDETQRKKQKTIPFVFTYTKNKGEKNESKVKARVELSLANMEKLKNSFKEIVPECRQAFQIRIRQLEQILAPFVDAKDLPSAAWNLEGQVEVNLLQKRPDYSDSWFFDDFSDVK